jgi:hypothetical protein
MTSSTAARTFHPFPELPTELKLEVLRNLLIFDHHRIAANSHEYHTPVLLSIALVSKEMRDLAYSIYYGENRFLMIEDFHDLNKGIKVQSFKTPGLSVGQHIRRIVIYLTLTASDGMRKDWDYLLGDDENDTRIQWQRRVPNLAFCSLEAFSFGINGCWDPHLDGLIKFFKGKTVLLEARKVDVHVAYVCGGDSEGRTLHPHCEKIVEATLNDVIGQKSTEGVSSTAAATESAEKTVASEETGTKESPIVLT